MIFHRLLQGAGTRSRHRQDLLRPTRRLDDQRNANPNGIGLSPDQCTLDVAETETSRLWAYDILEPGIVRKVPYPSPNGGGLICGLPSYQRLDSLGVQANGDICVATLLTGRISVILPDGALVREVTMPDHHATNICFGGDDLRTAYITQSTLGLLIEMPWPEPGVQLNYEI
ncbi:SMP-30/gluconolactonase/LRE family protein [Paraburkholderia phytofirmans]